MKRMIAFMMAMVLCMSMLAACGGSEGEAADGEIKGDVFDAGNVSALVPKGWKAFPVTDAWAEEEGAMDPNQVSICKDGDSEWDLFSKPYISVIYYGADCLVRNSEKFSVYGMLFKLFRNKMLLCNLELFLISVT